MHIVDYLGIKDPFTQCKKQNGGYEFSEEDANFLSELMFKFTRKKADDVRQTEYTLEISMDAINNPETMRWIALKYVYSTTL